MITTTLSRPAADRTAIPPSLLADFATAAYWTETEIADWLSHIGWRVECFLARDDTECFVAVDAVTPRAVISFRGTEVTKIRDWLSDLDSRLVTWVHGRVHAGFARSVGRVFAELWPVLGELANRDVALHFTGHSKGAAEATIAAARLCAANKPVAGLCTFGSPRVGDAQFAAWLDAALPFAIQRFVHNNDLVTRVPLPAEWIAKCVPFGWLLPVGYRHCGELHYISSRGEVLIEPPRRRLTADRLRGRWLAGRNWWTDGLRDHPMWLYRDALHHLRP